MNATLLLLVQLVLILVMARLCGAFLGRLGQPPVIGEMMAGLLLGSIVFGAWLPDLHATLFAKPSLPALSGLGTVGVALFMFIVGVELRAPGGSRAQVRAAATIGLVGVALPLVLGLAIAPVLYRSFAPDGVAYWPFALFIAAAMSVTAFPVLARILKDRNLTHSTPGRLALSAAVIDDGCVWVFLAIVLALAGGGSPAGVLVAIGGGLALVAMVFLLLKPLYARLLRTSGDSGEPDASMLVWILVGVLGCAAFAEWIGLHAVFGAFLFGVALPRDDRLLSFLARRIEPVAIVLLMPVVFALAGQNTTLEAFAGAGIGAFGLILLAAVAGKVIGCAAGARLSGHGWRDSLAVGSLMNARGLMELIVIKIGFDAGLIGPELFTMLFAMTLATTLMASPLLALFYRRPADAKAGLAPELRVDS
ncbi:cation:proton antiporter [Pseudoxanthomonas daejeonensis]|uniref:cation:proton antiporter n=1 Tax=Pseudoxanthomonas daejeonensis TaxID=266062 RepID=UPI001F5475E6|nr:cation:proton antiporter [Pseudoxanthomonas daejeonensis]UNK56499.1 cation:proton antiporter [Pseudoxanthomonas daejeonensis]